MEFWRCQAFDFRNIYRHTHVTHTHTHTRDKVLRGREGIDLARHNNFIWPVSYIFWYLLLLSVGYHHTHVFTKIYRSFLLLSPFHLKLFDLSVTFFSFFFFIYELFYDYLIVRVTQKFDLPVRPRRAHSCQTTGAAQVRRSPLRYIKNIVSSNPPQKQKKNLFNLNRKKKEEISVILCFYRNVFRWFI